MNSNRFSMRGRVALVTGASSGLGTHFARVLAEAGAMVVVAARRLERLESLRDDIASTGGKVIAVALDVNDNASIKDAFVRAESQLGTVDVLVNNAGIGDACRFLDMEEDAWDNMIDTNLKSVWRLSQEFCHRLIEAGKPGCVVNIASILGLRVSRQLSHYAVAKAGVIQLTKASALEMAPHGIRVNAIAPGYIKTEMNAGFFETDKGGEYIKRKVPFGRLGQLEELSGPLLLLVSEAGSFMTGSVITVDGGHLNSSL